MKKTGRAGAPFRIGISACLLGERVRYDGQDKRDRLVIEGMGVPVEWVPVCPEVGMGLPVPREAMRLVGNPPVPRLVEIGSGRDWTAPMVRWSVRKVEELEGMDLCGFIFKSRSPSCGLAGVAVHTPGGLRCGTGRGLFAAALIDHLPGIPVEDEVRLRDPGIRDRFFDRVFRFRREGRRMSFLPGGGDG